MKIIRLILTIIITMSISCKGDSKKNIDTQETNQIDQNSIKKLEISLSPKNESNIGGKITFIEEDQLVSMEANLTGLSEGQHAIHIRSKADCSSADGKWEVKEGYHKGNIGNFKADANGTGNITFATNEWCIGCDDDKKNIVGKAIIVHQRTDDLTSQPSGAGGSRVSCIAIIQ